ncbi:hypothetical protein [Piscinibacter sp. XHJ-5]|uniref:hypothetical protein n=1 Tax=Piscinibacter sp. XHJ-5 TaxID=3037797 RepID=UPI002452F6F6|nr:hypothetical protein [Piscinibacter sp. XHJ-5]
MAEPRSRTLLDFAIAASAAVLPMMLGILLLVAVVRPLDPPAAQGDRYVSVRHVAALRTFEHAIVARPARSAGQEIRTEALLEALPQCRREWTAPGSLRSMLGLQAAAASPAERIAAQLGELDAQLARFGSRANARVDRAVGFDAPRWFEEAQRVLGAPFEVPDYPGLRFQVRCADLAAALTALTRADGRMLDALAWRGTETPATVAGWRAEQVMAVAPRDVARRNPWNGIAGCIYLGARGDAATPTHFVAAERSAQERLCALPAMSGASAAGPLTALSGEPRADLPVDDARWMVPPSLSALLQPLEGLRRPSAALYRHYTELGESGGERPTAYRYGPNRLLFDGTPVDVGFSIDLTIDPSLQALAQKTAACYTGRQDVCRALGVQRAEDAGKAIGHRLLEGAMVRMAAVAVIDVASGRIEALAGALSPCARQEVDGPGRAANCDRRLPYPVQYRPDALLNAAVFHDAMPASTIKPIMATAFLADRDVGARWLAAERAAMKPGAQPARDSLRGQLMRSDSARFLDRMFCFDKAYADCKRPWDLQTTAQAFGWNTGCTDARVDCGKQDLLFGRAVDATAEKGAIRPLATTVAYGRLMSEPVGGQLGAPQQLRAPSALDAAIVRRCAFGADGRRGSDDDWEKCRGGAVVDVVAEGWGQGHARSSALGVAGMMATLAAAANGQEQIRRPHVVQSLRGVRQACPEPCRGGDGTALQSAVMRWSLAPAQPNRVPRDAAEVILDGLSYSHRAGTARSACEQVFDAKACRGIGWLAGKTGTPSFPSDGKSLDEIARLCRGDAATRASHAVCGSLRPYKWYVAAYRTDPRGGPWTKAIAVLTERNWLVNSGQVHGAGDHGPNPSAEIAMQITGRQLGLIPGAAP